jgi:hypothetical protein
MDATTATTTSVTLAGPSGNVAGAVSTSGSTITFKPTAALAPNASYTLTLAATVASAKGVPVGTAVTVTFTTTNAPEITSITPVDTATNQPTMTTKPVLNFSQPIDSTTLTTTNVTLVRVDTNASVPQNPSFNATTNQLTILPTTSLDYSAQYRITLSTAVKSTAAAGALPLATAFTSTFWTTGDGVTTRIDAGATADFTDAAGNLWLKDQYFSGGTAASNANTISNTTDPKLFQTYRWGLFTYTINMPNGYYDADWMYSEPTATYNACGKRTFFLDNLLTTATNDLTVDPFCDSGAVNKAWTKSMPLVAVTGRAYRFKSVTSVDQPLLMAFRATPHPPTVTTTAPAAGATAVPATSTVTATFSQAMRAASITTSTFTVDGGAVAGTVAYDSTTTKATFTPSSPLASGTHTAKVAGALDQYGMAQKTTQTWTFTVS